MAGAPFPLRSFRSSVYPNRDNLRTKPDCLHHRLSLSECRFGRSGSSGFVVGFRHLRWSGYVPAPKVRRNLGRCRYRYTCRPGGFPARGGCRPKRLGFSLRGRLKLPDWFTDDLFLSFCPRS